MFADPQSLTVNAVAKSLPRVGSEQPTRLQNFQTADGEFQLSIRQDKSTGRFRREARFIQKKVAADPISAVNKEVSASVIITVDEPRWGFSDTDLGYLIAALKTWFDSTSSGKLLGGEL